MLVEVVPHRVRRLESHGQLVQWSRISSRPPSSRSRVQLPRRDPEAPSPCRRLVQPVAPAVGRRARRRPPSGVGAEQARSRSPGRRGTAARPWRRPSTHEVGPGERWVASPTRPRCASYVVAEPLEHRARTSVAVLEAVATALRLPTNFSCTASQARHPGWLPSRTSKFSNGNVPHVRLVQLGRERRGPGSRRGHADDRVEVAPEQVELGRACHGMLGHGRVRRRRRRSCGARGGWRWPR